MDAEQTKADALISYCGGCMYLLWAARELLGSKIDIYHLIEIIRMSMGEKLNYPEDHIKRAWDIIAIISYQLLLSMVQKRFYISRITYDKNRSTFKPKRHSLLRVIRILFNLELIRKIYRKIFQLLMPIMKTR